MTQLTEKTVSLDPIEQFANWFREASRSTAISDANAMCLSTIGANGYPDARIVLLKSFDKDGFSFFTNSSSAKGQSLAQSPRAALTFFWDPLHRQVRIQGDVEMLPEEESDVYFATRPRGSQLGAWASLQSTELDSRETLQRRIEEFNKKFYGTPVPRPPHWNGYRVSPFRIEFWQEQPDRLHDRLCFTRSGGSGWHLQRLYP